MVYNEVVVHIKRRHIVIKFLRDIRFPKFSMEKGSTWVMGGSVDEYLHCKKNGLISFPFAGGQCLFSDVAEIYDGYSRFKAFYGAGDYNGMTSDELKIEQLICGY